MDTWRGGHDFRSGAGPRGKSAVQNLWSESLVRQVFKDDTHEGSFRRNGYVVVNLLDDVAVRDLLSFYADAFQTKRAVVPYAQQLPYYISIFDSDINHKRQVDELVSRNVKQELDALMIDYEVFYSNFMIKFPGDGQIEAHQDFNFVDESQHTAFNLWCPLVDTDTQNGGLFVISGSHNIFRTQRGPNLPKALTEYNDTLKKYARWVPLKKGQAIIFDHKLIHYSPPNSTRQARVAVQSVLTPRETPKVHYVFDSGTAKVKAYKINKEFILENNLWEANLSDFPLDHEQDLIPFPTSDDVIRKLADLTLRNARSQTPERVRRMFHEDSVQQAFDQNGFVKLSILDRDEVQQLTELFIESTGGTVTNTQYGMYISLEEPDLEPKRALIRRVSDIVLPKVNHYFRDCKPHLGSFLVKAPGEDSYTYPHQDWTFVESPPYVSVTVWIALVDIDETNGALGFVKGSHSFFDKPVGSPSPDFQTCTQGHEAMLYEYLEFVPLKAGEAVAFDNRTIHGATPNRTSALRTAVAIGMTPVEAPLCHYFLVPKSLQGGHRTLAKLKVNEEFFERYSVAALKASFDGGGLPEDFELETTLMDDFIAFSGEEIRLLCEQAGLSKNGKHLIRSQAASNGGKAAGSAASRIKSVLGRVRKAMFGS
jgi:ectoine hydroxylase-related dioxygenase (phytanoyl-CoA dioxygenase family)